MKKIICLSVIATTLSLLSCRKTGKPTEFEIDYSTNVSMPSASITVNSPTTTVDFVTADVPTEQSSKFKSAGTSKDYIDEIKLRKLDVSSVGAGANLDYLKSVIIYIKADGVGEQEVASKSSFPTGVTSTSLDLSDVNIMNYIFQDNIKFRAVVTFDATSQTPDQTIKLDGTALVKAKLLKKKLF